MACIDFRTPVDFIHSSSTSTRKGMADVYGTDYFLAVNGLLAKTRIQQMCPSLSGQLQGTGLLLLRSISMHGVCTNHLPRKPSRHRNVLTCPGSQTLSRWHSGHSLPEHPCRCQREKRLAYLCRLRPSFDPHRQDSVCQGRLWRLPGADGLRIRFHHHRSLSFAVSLGKISQTQGRRQVAHTDRPARQYPLSLLSG